MIWKLSWFGTFMVSTMVRNTTSPTFRPKPGLPRKSEILTSGIELLLSGLGDRNRIDPVGIEGQAILDRRHLVERLLVAPDRAFGDVATVGEAEVGSVALE